MRISDWSSDVCSSDLRRRPREDRGQSCRAGSGSWGRVEGSGSRRCRADHLLGRGNRSVDGLRERLSARAACSGIWVAAEPSHNVCSNPGDGRGAEQQPTGSARREADAEGFFEHGAEANYGEAFINIDLGAGVLEFRDKDPEYHAGILASRPEIGRAHVGTPVTNEQL